jgi:hypothetical protein
MYDHSRSAYDETKGPLDEMFIRPICPYLSSFE